MAGLEDEIRAVADGGDPLDLGIDTLFVADPEDHRIALVAADKGIFAGIPPEAQDALREPCSAPMIAATSLGPCRDAPSSSDCARARHALPRPTSELSPRTQETLAPAASHYRLYLPFASLCCRRLSPVDPRSPCLPPAEFCPPCR